MYNSTYGCVIVTKTLQYHNVLTTAYLECPTYQLARTNLLRSVDSIITNINNINNLINRRSKERLIQIMLNGDQRLEHQQNLRIFESVHCYVSATGRMKWP